MSELQKELTRLQNLKQNRNKSPVDLEKEATLNCWKRQLKIDERFLDIDEKKIAIDLFENYLQNYVFGNYNEASLLTDLIYEQVLQIRIEKSINKISADKTYTYIPDKSITALHEVQDRVAQLRERLGISKAKEKDDLTALQMLEKKFETYIPFHRNEFTTVAPCCGTVLLLRRRCSNDKFENLIHPMFSGRFYFNRRGIELVKKGIWTREQYAFVFFTSPQFVDWCILNENKIVTIEGVEQSKIEEFIKNNPYLRETHVPAKILEVNTGDK